MFEISKSIGFDYGHRVWTQKLNSEFSIDDSCVCRHLHGHRAKVDVHLKSDTLDPQGMVTDFKHLGWLKQFLDNYIDHKFILDKNDPLFDKFLGTDYDHLYPIPIPGTKTIVGECVEPYAPAGTPEYEWYESFFIVDFIPTSENLSKWLHNIVETKMEELNVEVPKIVWWETPTSKSMYIKK